MIETGIPILPAKRQKWLAAIRTSDCRSLGELWCDAAADRILPRRSQLGARQLKEIMPSIGISEYLSPDAIIVRLQGERLRRLLGVSLTGRNIVETVPPAFRPVRIARYKACVGLPCGMLFIVPALWTTGHQTAIEAIVLPLLPDRDGDPMQFILAYEEIRNFDLFPGDGLAAFDEVMAVRERIEFLDLGNGIPDTDPGLALMPKSAGQ